MMNELSGAIEKYYNDPQYTPENNKPYPNPHDIRL